MTTASSPSDGILSEFWYRRLHSFTGFFPLTLFLVGHFLGNLYATKKDTGVAFNEYAEKLHSLPFFNLLELSILIPLAFHGCYGIYRVVTKERWNALSIRNESNSRYVAQRVSGIIVFIFAIVHLYSTRFQQLFFGTEIDYSYMSEHLSQPLYACIYALGIVAASYHWANGLWGFLITWGITTGPRAQQVSAKLCLALGVGVGLLGLNALLGFYDMGVSFDF